MDGETILGVIIGMALFGLIPGFIAKSKERNFWGFWLLGCCFFWPGFIAALIVKNKKKERLRNEAELAGYEKLFQEGKITKDELSDKRFKLLGYR